SNDSTTRPVALILALAFIIIVTTDSIYDYQELHNMYATGTMLDVGWPLGYMLVGLGARASRVVMVSRTLSARTTAGANLLKEEVARERAERIRAERIIALNDALAASQQDTPHARILALGHYQVRDSQGIYYNVYHRVVGEQQVFECECSQYQQQSICPHSLM